MLTPAASWRLASTRKLITGSFAVSSRQISNTNDTAEITANVVTNRDSNQSYRSPRSSIHCNEPTQSASSRMP